MSLLQQIDIVRDLELFSTSSSEFLYNQYQSFVKNYKKKIQKGIFDYDLGVKGIYNNFVPRIIKEYERELLRNQEKIFLTKEQKLLLSKIILGYILDDIKYL